MRDQFLVRKVLFLAVFASISASMQVFSQNFIYWKPHLLQEFWRLWTGHWVHVGWIHYFLNLFAFICLPFIFPRVKTWHFWALLLVFPPFISLGFYYFLADIEAYAGLSGVLHGAYVSIAIVHLFHGRDRGFSGLVLFLIFAKLIWENTVGNTGTAELIGSAVLVEAHLLGVICGIVMAVLYLVLSRYWENSLN